MGGLLHAGDLLTLYANTNFQHTEITYCEIVIRKVVFLNFKLECWKSPLIFACSQLFCSL